MKKIFKIATLALVTITSLASCGAPQISKEQAKVEINNIQNTQIEIESLGKKGYFRIDQNVDSTQAKISASQEISYDLDKNYFYSSHVYNDESMKAWLYVEDNTLHTATSIDGTLESTSISISSIDISTYFNNYIEQLVSVLETFSTQLTSSLTEEYDISINYDGFGKMAYETIYRSNGTGNFIVDSKCNYYLNEDFVVYNVENKFDGKFYMEFQDGIYSKHEITYSYSSKTLELGTENTKLSYSTKATTTGYFDRTKAIYNYPPKQ